MALFAAFALAWVALEEVVGARLQKAYPLMQVVWCRYAVHLLLLLAIFAWLQPQRLWRTQRPGFHLLRSLCMLVMPLSFVAALQAGVHADAVWSLFWLAPLMLLPIAARWLGERASARTWWTSLGGSLSAALMLWPRQGLPLGVGLLLPLVMALSFAVYVVMTRSLRTEAVQANLFYTAFGVFAVLTPFIPALWVMPTPADALVLAAIGAVGLIALLLLDRAAAAAPLSLAGPALYVYLPALALVDWWLDGGAPGQRMMLAVALVAALMALLWRQLSATGTWTTIPSR